MAYNDYGAFVFMNGKRRTDKEDAPAFASDQEIFGGDINNIPSVARIFISLSKAKEDGRELSWLEHIHHGICGDGNVRVICHKWGLPKIFEATDDGIQQIEFCDEDDARWFKYRPFSFEYNGFHFYFEYFEPGFLYVVEMDEPDGTHWRCEYGYEYGAGFEKGDE